MRALTHKPRKRTESYSNYQIILKKVRTSDKVKVGFISSILEDILSIKYKNREYRVFKNLINKLENDNVILSISSRDLEDYEIDLDRYDKLVPSRMKFFRHKKFLLPAKKSLSSSKKMTTVLSKDKIHVGYLVNVGGRFLTIYHPFTDNGGYDFKIYKSRVKGFDNKGNITLNISFKKVNELRRFQRKYCYFRHLSRQYIPTWRLVAYDLVSEISDGQLDLGSLVELFKK